jgi:hypothetical protein
MTTHIIFAGKRGRLTGFLSGTEASFLSEIAVRNGVPQSAIMVEEDSTNTLENIQCAWTRLSRESIQAKRLAGQSPSASGMAPIWSF